MPNYDAIWLIHRVHVIYSNSETHRRLLEVSSVPYPNDPRCRALGRSVNRKSNVLNNRECGFLNTFPEHGLDLGFYANGLIFAPEVCRLSVRDHAALVGLVRFGYLGICVGIRDGKTVEILVRVK
jgi:hypothetical protein